VTIRGSRYNLACNDPAFEQDGLLSSAFV